MSDHQEQGDDRWRDPFASQLRHFDQLLADFRKFYDNLSPNERVGFRTWLERVEALAVEGYSWGAQLRVRAEHDECDQHDNVVRWADTEFSCSTMLSAVQAWEAGEGFAPPSVLP